ncbi:MAG: Kae1-associated serine/threonine protein kinase [Nanoarchaeota archaeon]|nr:Kae1-associated serine/threonine protein kinase [Nanoarchaeota archaeon]MBU4086655.1 Kae1-associated serine/threonine protein kinase [Nanoarchaeota archaeon]
MGKLIARGAEAEITLDKNTVLKNRIKKSYRITELDEKLRKSRTKSEAKLLEKASGLINTPKVLNQDNFSIELEYLDGERLSETLSSKPEKEQYNIMEQVGGQVAKLHDSDIIHGDLTTSNLILVKNSKLSDKKPLNLIDNQSKQSEKDLELTNNIKITQSERAGAVHREAKLKNPEPSSQDKVYLIDFGLGFISKRIEDKAVDLHLIKQALEAKHFQNHERLFKAFLDYYKWPDSEKVLEQLKKVEARGRYRKNAH